MPEKDSDAPAPAPANTVAPPTDTNDQAERMERQRQLAIRSTLENVCRKREKTCELMMKALEPGSALGETEKQNMIKEAQSISLRADRMLPS